ncbi:MAG: RHS repeat-associated core domain-containing protein, partial [Exilibacterium sp.]
DAIRNRYNTYGYLSRVVDAFKPSTRYYVVQEMDERGNVTKALNGNGVTSYRGYDPATGRLETLRGELSYGLGDVQDHTYTWNKIGNLIERTDQSGNKDLTETFGYDDLNRLETAEVTGRLREVQVYDSLGNIKAKLGHSYHYGNDPDTNKPHAVKSMNGVSYSYDSNGNMIANTANGKIGARTLKYTTFDKPYEITQRGHTVKFAYGPDRARYARIDIDENQNVTSTVYIGNVEKIQKPDGSQQIKRYLPGGAVITIERDNRGNETGRTTHYLYKDYLGSVDVITDAVGTVVQQMSFDAWGWRRNAVNWEELDPGSLRYFDSNLTTQGFTGHEMIDGVELIHMNGRIYDPLLGRFLQADPFIQAASNTQSYNRYSYGFNNPLNGTDPSGYLFGIDDVIAAFVIGAFIGEAGRQLDIPLLQAIGSAVSCIGGNVAVCGAAAFGSTLGYTHDFGMALQSGFFATMSAAAFSSVGVEFNGTPLEGGWAHIGAHAFTGGVMSVLQGGKFGHGFVSAGFTKAAKIIMPNNAEYLADTVRVVAAAVVGGTVSKVTGGKFANGAATAAFAQAFNGNGAIERRNAQKKQNMIKEDYLSWEEADQILRNNNDPDLIVAVRADLLVVQQTSNFYIDPNTGEVRAGGMVMGIPEYLVHGQVTIRDRGDGTYGIYQQQYNFEQRSVNNAYDVIRNIETFFGGIISSDGTPFWIQYDGNANVIKK